MGSEVSAARVSIPEERFTDERDRKSERALGKKVFMSRNTALWPVGTSSESMLAFSKLIDPFLPSELCVSHERESPVFYLPSSWTANGPSCQRDSEITILNQLNTIASVNFQNNRTAQRCHTDQGRLASASGSVTPPL